MIADMHQRGLDHRAHSFAVRFEGLGEFRQRGTGGGNAAQFQKKAMKNQLAILFGLHTAPRRVGQSIVKQSALAPLLTSPFQGRAVVLRSFCTWKC